jgi:osmotically-inducible protein OsmY
MKRLFKLAAVGFAVRWLSDADHRAGLMARVRGLSGRMPAGATDALHGATDRARDVAQRAATSASGATETARTVADRATSVASDAADTARAAADRATETASEALGRDTDASGEDAANLAGNPDDARLTAKVESELYRDDDVPKGAININVEFGKVVLRGEVESRELIDDLVIRTRAIEGVNDVESLLHVPGEPAPMHE